MQLNVMAIRQDPGAGWRRIEFCGVAFSRLVASAHLLSNFARAIIARFSGNIMKLKQY
jgi:hypothetical protein